MITMGSKIDLTQKDVKEKLHKAGFRIEKKAIRTFSTMAHASNTSPQSDKYVRETLNNAAEIAASNKRKTIRNEDIRVAAIAIDAGMKISKLSDVPTRKQRKKKE